MSALDRWLEQIELGKYAKSFAENDVDFDVLVDLSAADLKELGVSLGDRKRLLAAIRALAAEGAPPKTGRPAAQPPVHVSARGHAERRQLTVMFVDLVGSTELSTRMDPEELRDILTAYQNIVAREVARFDGEVAKYMGDGVLCYFGWPNAHEDDAERAVRAGLAIMAALSKTPIGDRGIQLARAGVSTGLVVVGDLIGERAAQEEAVVGETPNVAARLQALAGPSQVVVSEATRKLLGNMFDVTDLGRHELKGVSGKTAVYAVLGERTAESRFEARATGMLTDMVGRNRELDLLQDHWRQARSGRGRLVLLTGEAGIGKSRTVRALRDAVDGEAHLRVSYQCSPYHVESSLYPVVQHFTRAAGLSEADTRESRLEKLRAFLVTDTAPVYAAMLENVAEASDGQTSLSAQEQRTRTLQALVEELLAQARRQPVLFVVEDAHWIDDSTLELLDLCAAALESAPILMLVTARPSFAHAFANGTTSATIDLDRLAPDQILELIRSIAGGRSLPPGLADRISVKTDGVPLFVEELTKAVIESDYLRETERSYEIVDSPDRLSVPSSLQDSLLARLDRFPHVKEVAQMAACIGREFDYGLLEAISSLNTATLQMALTQLCDAELIHPTGDDPNPSFAFKHALVRDTAYDTLLLKTRRHLHGEIAAALERKYPQTVGATPELLAFHCAEAGQFDPAVKYYHQAGLQAIQRSAFPEAIKHLTKGLGALANLESSPAKDRRELDLQIALGPALMTHRGTGQPEVEEAYRRAEALAQATADSDNLFKARFGLWQRRHVSGDVAGAKAIAEDMIRSHERSPASGQRLQAHHTNWTSSMFSGMHEAACHHTSCGIAIYDKAEHQEHKYIYAAHDPAACGYTFNAISNWFLGNVDDGIGTIDEAVTLGQSLDHPVSYAITLLFSAIYYQLRRDTARAAGFAQHGIDLSVEYGIAGWRAALETIGACISAEHGDRDAVAEIRRGMRAFEATGNKLFWPLFHAFEARAVLRWGNPQDGLSLIEGALAHVATTGERWMDSELHRLYGEFSLANSIENKPQAERAFTDALNIARRQSAKSMALRAAVSLARLWAENGKRSEGVGLVEPLLSSFDVSAATLDLKEARALLEQMR